jgi:hypothetical protein
LCDSQGKVKKKSPLHDNNPKEGCCKMVESPYTLPLHEELLLAGGASWELVEAEVEKEKEASLVLEEDGPVQSSRLVVGLSPRRNHMGRHHSLHPARQQTPPIFKYCEH